MTTYDSKTEEQQPLVFRTMKEIEREPQKEQTEEETLASIEELVKRNERVLQVLAEL